MSPEREQFRSKPLFEPRAPHEPPPSPERLGFQARPMPPRPSDASRGAQCTPFDVSCLFLLSLADALMCILLLQRCTGLPTWMKVALTQRMKGQVGAAIHPPTSCKSDIAPFDGITDQPQPVDGEPETCHANTSMNSDVAKAIADHLRATTTPTKMAWGSAPGDPPVKPQQAAVDYRQLDQQLQQQHRHCYQSPRRPSRREQTRCASAQPRTLSPGVANYGLRSASPPQASYPRRPQTARASVGRATGRQSVRSQYSGSLTGTQPRSQTVQRARARPTTAGAVRVTPATVGIVRARPATASSAARWVDIEQHRPSLVVQ